MIKIENLTKVYDKTVLCGINASILAGRITGLVGPDGAGKTTLLRLIAGLLEPTSGKIDVFGAKSPLEIRKILGYMPQKFGLYEELTVLENLNLYAELRLLEPENRKKRFDELLRFTNLEQFTNRLARQLSGGMKQKLGLACALVKTPKLLLLDEPGVGVDPISRRDLWKMVRALVSDDVIVLWSTAYLEEAESCDDVLLLNEGKLIFKGHPCELARQMDGRVVQISNIDPKSARLKLKEMLKDANIIDGVFQAGSLRFVLQEPQTEIQGEIAVPVSPRFEDGFIAKLGGVPKGDSPLAVSMSGDCAMGTSLHPPLFAVVAKKLTKKFGSFTAAKEIDFEIHRGEIFGLLGPNGAGKSTTFKMLCGLLKPTSGEGFISGHNLLKSGSKARARLGYMAQKFSLYGDLSVRQNLAFFAGIYGLGFSARRKSVQSMLNIFDLEQYADSHSGMLPLGFKQRLSLACALMHEPDVLFLDEPTSGVDPITRREFWRHINALAEKGVTILVTTHFMDEAEFCDRICLIYNGVKIAEGTPNELKQSVSSDSLENAFISLIARN